MDKKAGIYSTEDGEDTSVQVEIACEARLTTVPTDMDRRLRWKADIFITAFMSFIYAVQFADKTMTSAATSLNLREDLDMVDGPAFSWVGSGFYLGYLIFEFPMSYILHTFPVARATAVLIFCWGIIIACSAACQGKASFLACRVLLGIFESAVTPAFVVLTAQWYKRNEHFARTLFWFAANGTGSIMASAIGYGLIVRQERRGLALSGWRIFYIIMGVVTIAVGVIFYLHMPNVPTEAWFLTEEEKCWQRERTRESHQGYGSKKIKWYQVREALIDPLTWMYFATALLNNIPNGGITTFMNLILRGWNYNEKESLLMSLPSGGSEVVGLLSVAVLSSYVGNNHRMVWACSGAALTMMCMCLVAWGPNAGAQLTGLYLWSTVSPVSFVALLAGVESNSAGHSKKLTTNAILLVGYCVGNLVGPQTFKSSEQPHYPTGKVTMAATASAYFIIECAIFAYYVLQNWRRDKNNKRLSPDLDPEAEDLTDWENPAFRYAL